ncbi:hypothetical protein, partial [Escherichia coli]|uniref:hypothetical protein n=1 Tax=Escherichia coli TaxID=562 RepID=UPI001C5756E2
NQMYQQVNLSDSNVSNNKKQLLNHKQKATTKSFSESKPSNSLSDLYSCVAFSRGLEDATDFVLMKFGGMGNPLKSRVKATKLCLPA